MTSYLVFLDRDSIIEPNRRVLTFAKQAMPRMGQTSMPHQPFQDKESLSDLVDIIKHYITEHHAGMLLRPDP
jgi:hypothetical protein